MAAHLEACPGARAVVNFSPVVLDQLASYGKETLDCVRDRRSTLSDPLLAVLEGRKSPQDFGKRALTQACLRANQAHLIERFPGFSALANLARAALQQTQTDAIQYLDDQFFTDLVVWYHLAWLGESVRRADPRIQELMKKEQDFSGEDRWTLFTVIAELLANLIDRYRTLADQGRIELSMSPYYHPILPLLLDFAVARESIPDAKLPESPSYPGGQTRAIWHLAEGRRVFHSYFERDPAGCWPSEGGISDAAVRLLDAQGFRWCASGQLVLQNSLGDAKTGSDLRHHPWSLPGTHTACFFRDVELSNLIGFSYKDWKAEDAVNDLMQRLETIAAQADGVAGRVVAIILDGENPWEYFPHNGYEFLNGIYNSFAEHPRLKLTTFSECLADPEVSVKDLPRLVAGSWVYGTLSTWIGDAGKNRAWDLLCDVKRCFDDLDPDSAQNPAVLHQLGVCEGSDWFWWFGDYNPAETVADFDTLFRDQLKSLYQLMGKPAPDILNIVISQGKGNPAAGGTMRGGY